MNGWGPEVNGGDSGCEVNKAASATISISVLDFRASGAGHSRLPIFSGQLYDSQVQSTRRSHEYREKF